MRFVFTKLFYLLMALGLILLSLSGAALAALGRARVRRRVDCPRDNRRAPQSTSQRRSHHARVRCWRFAVGAETDVHVQIQNAGAHAVSLS